MNLATTNEAGAVYNAYLNSFKNEDGSVNWLPVCVDAHGFVPFNRGSLPVVSGIAVEVKENNGSYTLTGITRNGQPLGDNDTVTVTCLATSKQMEALPASKSGTSAGEDALVKNTWTEYVSGGDAALAEPENYMTVTGETGYLGLQTNLDEKLAHDEDVVVNTALPGKAQMLAFICPETQGSYRGFAYDAIAISYYNDAVLRLLDNSAFEGNASNYVIYPDGRVVIDSSVNRKETMEGLDYGNASA